MSKTAKKLTRDRVVRAFVPFGLYLSDADVAVDRCHTDSGLIFAEVSGPDVAAWLADRQRVQKPSEIKEWFRGERGLYLLLAA